MKNQNQSPERSNNEPFNNDPNPLEKDQQENDINKRPSGTERNPGAGRTEYKPEETEFADGKGTNLNEEFRESPGRAERSNDRYEQEIPEDDPDFENPDDDPA